jgi:Cytochrome b5-like Heme/Steroid binding domain
MIRLGALRTAGRGLREWCRVLPPIVMMVMASKWYCYSALPHAFLLLTMTMTVAWHWRPIAEMRKERQDALGQPPLLLLSPTLPCPLPHDAKCDRLATSDIPTAVLAGICSYLHPRDVLQLTCLNKAAARQYASNMIWKQLWYRDFGNVLLQWHVGRQALNKSLLQTASATAKPQQPSSSRPQAHNLEFRLSQHLDQLGHGSGGLRDFYFLFGETYLNYLLAGRNSVDKQDCFLGLHGHILDFAPFASYHPGLIEPVLRECGQDATEFFESLPHSRGARSVARKLVVMVNRGCLSGNSCGLELQSPSSQLRKLLRASNSRPLCMEDSKELFPMHPDSPGKRPCTLSRIRTQWDCFKKEKEQVTMQNHRFWRPPFGTDPSWRTYYDPICQEWIEWNAAAAITS